jgi:hypothetical protein
MRTYKHTHACDWALATPRTLIVDVGKVEHDDADGAAVIAIDHPSTHVQKVLHREARPRRHPA